MGRWVALLWALASGGMGIAQPLPEQPLPEAPQPEEQPALILPSPVGDLEYRPGRGLHVGDLGLTLGGFTTALLERVEGEHPRVLLDDLHLITLFDPAPFFHVFSEMGFQDLVEFGGSRGEATKANLEIDRLYADLNVSDPLNLRAGQFFTPVGRWNLIPAEPLVWTTSRPLITDGTFEDEVTGPMLFGTVFPASTSLTYTAYGQFTNAIESDPDARTPDYVAGARLEWEARERWSVGSSYFTSRREGRWKHLGGLDLLWRGEGAEVMSELLIGRGDPLAPTLFGFYVQGVHEVVHKLSVVGRYEYFHAGGHLRAVNAFVLGLSWRPDPYLVLNADYFAVDRSGGLLEEQQDPPGFRFSFSVLF